MKRTLIAVIAVLGFATTASAASLTVSADQSVYQIGDTIVLTVVGTSDGSAEQDTAVFAEVQWDGGLASFVSSAQSSGGANAYFSI